MFSAVPLSHGIKNRGFLKLIQWLTRGTDTLSHLAGRLVLFSELTVPTSRSTPAPTGVDQAKVSAFQALYRKFITGTAWVERGYAQRGWMSGRHGFDTRFETDIKDFEEKVVKPMDAVWAELNEAERKATET